MNPNTAEDPNAEPIDFLYVNDLSVVTSGDYQRYYLADGKEFIISSIRTVCTLQIITSL